MDFHGIETELWPICCSNFTAFTGYLSTGEKTGITLGLEGNEDPTEMTAKLEGISTDELLEKIQDALDLEAKRLRENGMNIKNGKVLAEKLKNKEENVVGYLFKCIECDKYRVHIDFTQKN